MIDWDSCVLWLDSKYFSESYWWDRSKYRNDGVVHGAKWKADAFYFNDTDAYVDCGNSESLSIGNNLSIEALFIPVHDGYMIAKKNWDNWNNAYALAFEEAYRRLIFFGNGASSVRSNSNVLNINEKAHVVVVAENSGQTRFYINSKQQGSGTTPTFSGDGDRCFMGARPNTGETAASFIGAYFYFIRVYHKLLSSNEVKILYNLATGR